jgi:hypothetical protein
MEPSASRLSSWLMAWRETSSRWARWAWGIPKARRNVAIHPLRGRSNRALAWRIAASRSSRKSYLDNDDVASWWYQSGPSHTELVEESHDVRGVIVDRVAAVGAGRLTGTATRQSEDSVRVLEPIGKAGHAYAVWPPPA